MVHVGTRLHPKWKGSKYCWQKDNDGGDDASDNNNDDDWGKLLLVLLDVRCDSQNNPFKVTDHHQTPPIAAIQRCRETW